MTATVQAELSEALLQHVRTMRSVQESIIKPGDRRASWPYASTEALLLDRAQFWTQTPRPSWLYMGQEKFCYWNATNAVLGHPDRLVYCEGIGVSENLIIPLPHAWVLDKKTRRAYDITWRTTRERGTSALYGIAFDTNYLARVVSGSDRMGLIDRWEEEWPLLSGVHAIDEAMHRWER